ncbi:hypothetical protein FACS189490_12480 [Clostridia bacterium]|nr:hypothetical protein FACS189490_12480 [Clostridia bacterium]
MFGESTVHMSSMMYLLLADLPKNAVCTITVEKRIADAEMFYKMCFGCAYQAATQKKY